MANHSRYNIASLLITGLVFHLVYILSVFDCYFTSPVVNGMKGYNMGVAESKRLVLIVGDGLRADLFYSINAFHSVRHAPEVVAPHLRSIIESRGAFGISHTRVPTESRPGHVAIIGGMYEDVSAVTKGWKTNPVDFDSVFNQSSHTFSFGSPDILPMFAHGATPGKVKMWTYDEEDEDFTKDATALDIWVLEQLRTLFRNATMDLPLNSQLRSEKVVFFLHLLGLDTTGHSYRPHSEEYMNNIKVVDGIVRQTEALFSDFYRDDETSFIFTADHGMSTIGNHGDGDPDNTRTPLVAWGKGIRGPLPDSTPSSHDSFSEQWGLSHLLRRDVEQADIASLMAALIGINWPVNSVGVLPDVHPTRPGYLLPSKGDQTLASAAFVNAKVILEHYRFKHEQKKARTLFYKPFPELEGVGVTKNPPRLMKTAEIEQSIHDEEWHTARKKSAEIIQSALHGLNYLQTYDRLLIRSIVTIAYTGWAAYASLFIFRPLDIPGQKNASIMPTVITTILLFVLLSFWTLFALQRSPWTFYLYISFPCYFWQQFLVQIIPPFRAWPRSKNPAFVYVSWLARGGLVVAILQSMVAAYTHRSIWSVGFVLMGLVWPALSWPRELVSRHRLLLTSWAATCLLTAVFPILAVDKKESLVAILFGGVLILAIGAKAPGLLQGTEDRGHAGRSLVILFGIQLLLIATIMGITTNSVSNLQAKSGLPLFNQISGWVILVFASLLPFISRVQHPNSNSKLLMYFLGFGACFVILSISVEGIFYTVYSTTLFTWIEVESALRAYSTKSTNTRIYHFQLDDMRIALFFLFFVQVAFFGTGNVASISSFYLEPVYRLVPIFNPFLMAALLIFKIIAPYVMLSVVFATLNNRLHLPPFSLFLVALMLTDGMTLAFFFNVSDTGSWLEIGQSISFFCITSLLLLWSAGICAAGEYLMAGSDIVDRHRVDKSSTVKRQ